MKLVFVVIITFCLSSTFWWLEGSESASDCESAISTLEAGINTRPDDLLELYLDALRTNPGCRRSLLVTAIGAAQGDAMKVRWVVFMSRQEFPNELTLLAEAALGAAPEYSDIIKKAFFEDEKIMTAELADLEKERFAKMEVEPDIHSGLVQLPEETQKLDEDIREAIARMTAKVEGKAWPEQQVEKMNLAYKKADELRVSESRRQTDETSMENQLPFDSVDERKLVRKPVVIDDAGRPENEFHLDESKFAMNGRSDSRMAAEARQRELAPAGSIGLPAGPQLPRSSVYYIPPASGYYGSTIDLDNREQPRPSLVIRSAPTSPTDLR